MQTIFNRATAFSKSISHLPLLLVALVGCGAYPAREKPYQPPAAGEPSALLTIKNQSPPPFCALTVWAWEDAAKCQGPLANDSWRSIACNASVAIRVPADRDFSWTNLLRSYNKTCHIPDFTFTPAANENYIATFIATEQGCNVTLHREAKGKLIEESSFRARKTNMGGLTSSCE